MIIKEKYGICDGEQIYKYTLKSENLIAEILNYGGVVKSLKINGIEVVIGLNSLEEYTPVDESNCPDGRIEKVKGSCLDFTSPTPIGERMPCEEAKFLDKNYVLKGTGYRKVAEAVGDKTGIKMEVYTTEPGLQLYMPTSCSSFCLEAQKFPNAVNLSSFI